MKLKQLFLISLIILIIFSINILSANDLDNNTLSQQIEEMQNNNQNLEIDSSDLIKKVDESSRTIYVGKNTTLGGGNGSINNPYESFELASNNISNEDNVIINVFEGTYCLNSDIKFNTNNLNIIGQGNVIIKNLDNNPGSYASIGLISSKSNFTFTNLIFDANDSKYLSSTSENKPHFYAFNGGANLGIFNNCTFTGFNDATIINADFNKKFNYCNFFNGSGDFFLILLTKTYLTEFNYCNLVGSWNLFTYRIEFGANISFNNVWFGFNELPTYIYPPYGHVLNGHYYVKDYVIPVNRYAIFKTHENYLGENTFEIVGNLIWDDETSDGINNLGSKLIRFYSNTGDIENSTILENGTFKTIYKSNSNYNEIIVELDKHEYLISFNYGIEAIAKPIYCGDDQNISILLSQNSNGIININVNNKTYEIKLNDSSSINFQIPDELKSGCYIVQINFTDVINHYYGFKLLNWNISKINQKLVVSTPLGARINDKKIEIMVSLPADATGNISISKGENSITQKVSGGIISIDVSSLLEIGNNYILINYSGDNRYFNQIKNEIITVEKIFPNIQFNFPEQIKITDDVVNLTIKLPNNAYGNITVFNNDKNRTYGTNGGDNIINIASLLKSGINYIKIKYSGNGVYENQIKNLNLNVDKLNTPMIINLSKYTFETNEKITFSVSLKDNISGNIVVNINSKNYTKELVNSKAIFEINDLIKGTHNLQIKFMGNNEYNSISQILTIFVKEISKQNSIDKILVTKQVKLNSKIIAKKKFFKSKLKVKKYVITLKSGKKPIKKVKVTIKIGKKTYSAKTNAKGKATFKIKKLTKKGKYLAIIKFKGNKTYKTSNKKVKIVIK